MNRDDYERLQAVFEQALELEGDARADFLDRTCAGEETLRHNVERLLAQDSAEDVHALDTQAGLGHELLADAVAGKRGPAGAVASESDRLPRQIGRYRIREKIAEGGMGAVYLAEQDQPRRAVALKVIRPGVFSQEILRRFEFEAELLGRLQHPGIAQIYEAGEEQTEAGRQPYFAMEYVDGVELVRYAADHALDNDARLELLARVCDAVHHAHQKGIVHRDLKPGNILVAPAPTTSTKTTTSRFALLGQPKVLDFGVSRLAHEGQFETTQLTQAGHVLGTPAYMSPEQARGEVALDTRSDVYSLGVISFELLSGRLPHDLGDLPLMRALQLVQQTPAPPLDSTDPRLRGDLSVIIAKALEPEPERRYASAAALADDIRRYLADQPIAARPPTIGYLLARFVRRNTALVAAGFVALLSLAGGLVVALSARAGEARQRAVAERRSDEAERSAYATRTQAVMAYAISGERQAAGRLLEATNPALRGWEWNYLSSLLADDIEHFAMTVRSWPSSQLLPGATRALFAVNATTLRLFDFEARTWVDSIYPGQESAGSGAVAFLADRGMILWAGPGGRVQLLGIDGHRAPQPVCETGVELAGIRVSANERRAVLHGRRSGGTPASSVFLLDLANLRILRQLESLPEIRDLAMDPDGSRIAVASRGRSTVRILDGDTLECTSVLRGHDRQVEVLAFSSSGRYLASGADDRTVRIWSLPDGTQQRVLGPVRYRPNALAFLDDGKTLVAGHESARVRRWNLETGACESLTAGQPTSDPYERMVLQLGSTGKDFVYAVCADGIRIRALRELFPSVLHHASGSYPFVYDVEFSPSGRVLASSGWDGKVRFWDVATGRAITALECPGQVFWTTYSNDGRWLLTCSQQWYRKHTFRLWNATTLRLVGEMTGETNCPCGVFVPGARAIVLGVAKELWTVDPVSFTVREKRRQPASVYALALSPDGTRLSCALEDGRLNVLDATTLEPVRCFQAHAAGFEAIAYSRDGQRLATGGTDDEVRVWDARSGEQQLSLDSPGSRELFSLCFTADGTRILSGSRRESIGVWDASSGMELMRLHGHEAYVHALAMSRDGRILASASGDNTVRIWDTRPLAERLTGKKRLLAAERAVRSEVERYLRELGTPEKALDAIDADPQLGPLERHAAWIVAHRVPQPK